MSARLTLSNVLPLSLTTQELALLAVLARQQGEVVGFEQLWREVWKYEGRPDRSVIQRAMSRLRQKIGKGRILSVRGRGYSLR